MAATAAGKKRRRVVLNTEQKLKICDLVESGRTLMSVPQEFNTAKSTVDDIVKKKAKLTAFLTEIEDGACVIKRLIARRADLEKLDKAVYLWFVQQRCKGTPVMHSLYMCMQFQLSLL